MPVDTTPEPRLGVAKEELTGLAGLALAAGLVKYLGLAEPLARRASGLRAVPDSWRLGEYLGRMTVGVLAGLAECARIVSRRLVRSGWRQRLLFGRGNYRLDWLVYAAGRLEPG